MLCRAGPHRLAFQAMQVMTIEASSGTPCPHARQAFALPPVAGRVLFTEDGPVLAVDTLEVSQESLPLWPAPAMLTGRAGGSLRGFVSTGDGLWPVLELTAFARFLAEAPGG